MRAIILSYVALVVSCMAFVFSFVFWWPLLVYVWGYWFG
jgi:hypothetical protein